MLQEYLSRSVEGTALRVTLSRDGEEVGVALQGEATREHAPMLYRALSEALGRMPQRLCVDLGGVSECDSAAFQLCVALQHELGRERLLMHHPSPAVRATWLWYGWDAGTSDAAASVFVAPDAIARDEAWHRRVLAELAELLDAVERSVLAWARQEAGQGEALEGLRHLHSLRGQAHMLGLAAIEAAAQHLEALWHADRDVAEPGRSALVEALLTGCDHLRALLDWAMHACALAQDNASLPPSFSTTVGSMTESADRVGLGREPARDEALADCWHAQVRFDRDTFRRGIEPLDVLRAWRRLAVFPRMCLDIAAIPRLTALNPQDCHIAFTLWLRTRADRSALEAAYELCRDMCHVTWTPPATDRERWFRCLQELPEVPFRLGEILLRSQAIGPQTLARALHAQRQTADLQQAPPLGETLVRQEGVSPELIAAALRQQQRLRQRLHEDAAWVRVPRAEWQRLTQLLQRWLIPYRDGASSLRPDGIASPSSDRGCDELLREILQRLTVLQREPLAPVWAMLQRYAYELAKGFGKTVQCHTRGGELSLPPEQVSAIREIAVHLLRNAIEHGIEPPAQRLAVGKPELGRVELSAEVIPAGVAVSVQDDGRGLDVAQLQSQAARLGIVLQTQSGAEAIECCFHPGLTSRPQSARGMGLYAVWQRAQELGAIVTLWAAPDRGCRVEVRLPDQKEPVFGEAAATPRTSP